MLTAKRAKDLPLPLLRKEGSSGTPPYEGGVGGGHVLAVSHRGVFNVRYLDYRR
jgi:hypothetical protein